MDTLSILTNVILGFPIVCRETCTQSSDWILAHVNDISTGCFCLIFVLRQVFCPVNEFNLDFINPSYWRSQSRFQTLGGLELMTDDVYRANPLSRRWRVNFAWRNEMTFCIDLPQMILGFIPIKGLLRVIWIIQICLSMVLGKEKPPVVRACFSMHPWAQ